MEPNEVEKVANYTVRPPRQERSRQAWECVLAAGVALLSEGGYEAFTIAAMCERAGVPPRAIYARVDTKDALLLAVYEHGLARVQQDIRQVFHRLPDARSSPEVLVRELVGGVAGVFYEHEGFLKPVLLLSATHPEVHRRGSASSRSLGEDFVDAMQGLSLGVTHRDPVNALRFCYGMVHSAIVMRTMYGPGFAVPGVSQETFVASLVESVGRYLFVAPHSFEWDGNPSARGCSEWAASRP